jgi:hypothetical protein
MTVQRDQAYDLGDPMFATDDFRCFRYKVCGVYSFWPERLADDFAGVASPPVSCVYVIVHLGFPRHIGIF